MNSPADNILSHDELLKVAGALVHGASALSGLERVAAYLDDRVAALKPNIGVSSQLELLLAEVCTIRAVVKAEMKAITDNGGGR